jgi:hypothetical protein
MECVSTSFFSIAFDCPPANSRRFTAELGTCRYCEDFHNLLPSKVKKVKRAGLAMVKIVKAAVTPVAVIDGRWLRRLVTGVGMDREAIAAVSAWQLASVAALPTRARY